MATVPEYQRKVSLRPANQQAASVRTSVDTFGGQIGRATQGLGQGVAKVGDAIAFKRQLEDDADGRKAFNAYRRAQRETLRAPETGYLNRTGENGVGVQRPAGERLRELRRQYGEGLSPAALEKYNTLVDGLQDQAHQSLLAHTSNETRNYIVNERTSTVEGYVEEAVTNWNDEALFDENLGLALREQGELATLQGWDAATRKQSAENLISSAFKQRIVRAAETDPEAAQALLDNSRDALTAADEYALDTGLKAAVLEAKANRFTRGFIRTTTVGAVSGGQRQSARYDAIDRADDGVVVEFETGPRRPERPNQEIVDVVATAAERVFGNGTRVVVTSGAEGDLPQHGSDRHQTGLAADVAIFRPDGSRVRADDADMKQFAIAAAEVGALGIGFGVGYMGGNTAHIDMVMPGGGQAHAWGYNAKAMRPVLEKAMNRGAALVLSNSPYENSLINRRLVSQLGEEDGITFIGAALNTPTVPAEVALPPEFMAANPDFAGMTVGEAYDTITAAIGDDIPARMGRPYFDAEAAYQAALAIEDPDEQAAALARIDMMTSLQNKARSEGRREAQEQAWNEYTETGRTDFPWQVKQEMGQSGWVAFQEATRRDQQGGTVTNPDTWEMLTRMASSDPTRFAELSLVQHYGKLSTADRKHFIGVQEAVKAEIAGIRRGVEEGSHKMNFDAAYKTADVVYEAMVDATTPAKMNDEMRQRRLQFQQQLTAMMRDFYDREQRQPDDAEIREMAGVLALPISMYNPNAGFLSGGFDGVDQMGDGALFDAASLPVGAQYDITVKYEDIPVADRNRITAQLASVGNGELPSQDEVVAAYENQRLMSVGLPPNIDIGMVPQKLIDAVKSDTPGVTDDEIVEMYQLFLMSR